MNIIANLLVGVMLLNGAVLTSFLSLQCWEDYCERQAKKQQAAKTQPGGVAK